MKQNKTAKQLTLSVVSMVVIALCLTVTSFAIVYSMVSVESNLFTTGTLKINLNDGKTILNEGEHMLEPGATIKKDFFIENQSTCDVYYKLYFQSVSGGLADVLHVRICDGDTVLVEGTPSQLTEKNVMAFESALKIGERKQLQIYFHFPQEAGNAAQSQSLSFDFVAKAVQVNNNPDKVFE